MKSRVRTSAIVVHEQKILTFRAEDPISGREFYFLPGGKIESDETAPEAAERETFEETGFKIKIDPSSAIDREYLFHWNGDDFDCLTLFYRGHLMSPMQTQVIDTPYNKGPVWIPIDQIKQTFSYSNEILSAILELI